MTTEYFKVRNGLTVGEDTFTVDATTGDTIITGNLTVNGDTVTLNTTELSVEDNKITLNKNVTGTPSLDAGIVVERGDGTDSALNWNESTDQWEQNRAGTSTVIPVNTSELAEVTNLYYTDSRARASLSAGTGISYNSSTGAITSTITQYTDALARSALSAGTGISYNSSTGAISIGQAVATTDSPTFATVTATGNYVKGAIRNSTSASAGDIWAVNSTGPASPFRGISLDNSTDTSRGPATILRSFSGGATSGIGTRGRLVFEKARGTAASPTAIQSGDIIGSIDATGYTSTGYVNDNIVAVIPAFFGFSASESWVSNTNLGTTFALTMAPSATTISSAANLIATLTINPQAATHRADTYTFQQGKTGTATYLAMDSAKITASLPIKYPTYTTAQRDALTPSAGWVLFNSSTNKLQCYDGTTWNDLF
jgi:hypothetical protein